MDFGQWDWTGDDDRPAWGRLWVRLRAGAFLGHGEGVYRRGLVSINVGWLARGGLLHLEIPGLRFVPNPLERLMRARTKYFAFAEITQVERCPPTPGGVLPGGLAPRIRLHFVAARPGAILPAGETLDDWLPATPAQHAARGRRARI